MNTQSQPIPESLISQNSIPRLLVVDDQPLNVQALYRIFSDDYEVFMATSGEDALDLCRQNPPDLILLDIVMSGMDGMEVCRELKRDPITREIPVIFVSARNDPNEESQALDAGAVDFISKPVNQKIVRARVRAHLSHKFQSDMLHQMAFVDGLTGLANRRYFDERLELEWRRCARNHVSLGLIMLDVDYFKRYNDHFGHQAGDDCLRKITHAMEKRAGRPGDLIARYGGEEFVCLLPDTDLLGVQYIADTLRQIVSALNLPHPYSDIATNVTISLGGTVCVPDGGQGPELLVRQADRLLYRAKGAGRNLAVIEEMFAREEPSQFVRGALSMPAATQSNSGPARTSENIALADMGVLMSHCAAHDTSAQKLFEQFRDGFLAQLPAATGVELADALRAYNFDRALTLLQQVMPDATIEKPQRSSDSRSTILLIDDSPDVIALLVVLLQKKYRVLVANNGEQALRLLDQQTNPDLVLLDIVLPGLNGLEVCRRIKSNPRSSTIPVLFLTARSDIADEQTGFAVGAADYITKPVSPPILLARVRAQLELTQRMSFLKQLIQYANDVILVIDQAGQIIDANERVRDMYGYTPAQILDLPVQKLVNQSWRAAWENSLARLELQDHVVFESRHHQRNGSEFPVEVSIRLVNIPSGKPLRLAIMRDIRERVQAREQLMVDAMIFAQSTESIMVTDSAHRILSVNQAFCSITGYTAQEVVGQRADVVRAGPPDPDRLKEVDAAIGSDGRWSGEVLNQRKNGELYHEQQTVNAVHDNDQQRTHFIVTGIDVSARKDLEQRFQHLSNFDIVTDLPNQFSLRDHVTQLLTQARRESRKTAILNVNLERFRTVNEGYGHARGDEVLRITARRLQEALGTGDLVARMGADNFICAIANLRDAEHASELADRLLKTINAPIRLGEQDITLSARVGIAIAPADGENVDALLRNADIAAALGKGSIGGTYIHFQKDHKIELEHARLIESGLREALPRGELCLYYQPKVSLDSGEMIGTEALLRWQHPTRGLLMPALFIPIAEQTGQIVAIGEWVIHEACRQARRWLDLGFPPLPVSVNVSALQFYKGDLLDVVKAALAESTIAPEMLELEVTESVLTADIEKTTALLHQVRELGVRLSIDDFGTGYSSLSYLKSFPLTTLKIDRSFIQDLATDPAGASIIRGITALGHSLNLEIIAEGVEDKEQIDFLRSIGCDQFQGYLFSRPLPAEQLSELLLEWRRMPALAANKSNEISGP